MKHGNPMVLDLMPPGFAGPGLAGYRTLLPLYNEEEDTFSPWAAFLPAGADGCEDLRTMDLDDLRHAAADARDNMAGWDSARGRVSHRFAMMLGEALGEFVPGDDSWTLMRWQGHRHDLPGATPVNAGGRGYCQQVVDPTAALTSIRELGMPEFMWCSTRAFAWGAPLYPDFGVMTMSARHYIQHFAPRGFEAFYLPPDAVLPDNLGD